MSLQSIFVVNTAPGCDNFIQQQISADTCNSYIIRITPNTNALGPFDVYVSTYPTPLSGATLIYSAQTRTQMLNGVVVQLGPCVTPTPTPTPTTTPPPTTPSQTPTNTATPSETPTNTPTPSFTPTSSETPTPTPTFTSTPTNTPTYTPSETPTQTQTPTNTETPTQTPTNTPTTTETPTETPTQTPTPSPSPSPSVFEILIIDQLGNVLITQDGNPLILQEDSTAYLVSSGDSSCTCTTYTLTQTIYSPTSQWTNVLRFFSDAALTSTFNGNNLWYSNTIDTSGGMWQIGTDGFVIGNLCGPC
jgi:hypothetical protein